MEHIKQNSTRHRAMASVMAMVFLVITATLAIGMASLARTNSQISYNQIHAGQARANAEAGMRFIAWKFNSLKLPATTAGTISSTVAAGLWSTNSSNIASLVRDNINAMDGATRKQSAAVEGATLHVYDTYLTGDPKSAFEVLASPKSSAMAQVITVKVIGKYRGVERTISMDFLIQKTFLNGVVSRIPVQIGKNTVVEGDILVYANATKNGQAPVLSVDDFLYTGITSDNPTLHQRMLAFNDWMDSNCPAHDNRVGVDRLGSLRAADSSLQSISDYNSDGFVDEYDIFLQYFDSSGDHRISQSEFNNRAPNDPNLFFNIDRGIGKPANSSEPVRFGYNDGYLDDLDPYAKVYGTIRMSASADAVTAATGKSIGDLMQGSFISRDGYSAAVVFGYKPDEDPAAQLTPASFNMSTFLDNAGTNAGGEVHPTSAANPGSVDSGAATMIRTYANTTIRKADANGSVSSALPETLTNIAGNGATLSSTTTNGGVTTKTYTTTIDGKAATEVLEFKSVSGQSEPVLVSVTENVPYGVPDASRRSTCKRSVFSNVNFRNCLINRGTNALFINCTFDGVTFVDGANNLGQSADAYADGNNLRFLNSTVTGPLAQGDAHASDAKRGAAPSNYTDYTNSWEFNGATTIDFSRPSYDGTSDSMALAALKQQTTIMAPQTNIEMGSFTSPGNATCSFQGVVVGGCFDVRGVADIDGTIIVIGGDSTNPQGKAGGGNCTLGYFGPNDNAQDPYAVDKAVNGAAYGRIHVRFNPYRSLPDGINLNVSMSPDTSTWREVVQ